MCIRDRPSAGLVSPRAPMKLLSSFHGHPCYSCAGARSRDACHVPASHSSPGSHARTRRLAASLYNTGGARALHRIATKDDELRLPCFKTSTLVSREVCSDHDGLKHDTEDYVHYLTVDRRGMRSMFIQQSPRKKSAFTSLCTARRHDGARGSRRRRRRLAGGLGLSSISADYRVSHHRGSVEGAP